MNYPVFLYLPTKSAILSFEPGTGDNLGQEDINAGFDGYLNWSLKALGGDIELMDDPEAGGMVLYDSKKQDLLSNPLAAIVPVLTEAINDPLAPYVVLAQDEPEEVGELASIMTISSGHIKPETRELMTEEARASLLLHLSIYEKNPFGWYIYIDVLDLDGIQAAIDGTASMNTVSDPAWEQVPDLMECIRFAKLQGASVLCLDCDGVEVNSLPMY